MTGMAVFSAPGIPDGWEREEVVRIVDPLGLAVAWIAPARAGACVGLSARKTAGDPWETVLASDRTSGELACEAICVPDERQPAPLRCVASLSVLSERDPTQVTVLVQLAGGALFVRARCDEGSFTFGWFRPDREEEPVSCGGLDIRLVSGGDTPVSVTRHMEVNGIDFEIHPVAHTRGPRPSLVSGTTKG